MNSQRVQWIRSDWSRLAVIVLLGAAVAVPASALVQVDVDTVRAGRFDAGKMWTFEYPPAAYFEEAYGLQADEAWFERARMAALRIPGCSASFVSPNGLLATNHHCVRGAVSQVSRPGEGLLDNGFYATSVDAERRLPEYYADQLVAIEDVSREVFAAEDAATSDEARDRAREAAYARIRARLLAAHASPGDSMWVQMIALYHGGRHSAYVFRRFTDIRLVAAVELLTGFFGGDPDNFTYPRHALDFAFLRVYDEGRPYQTDHYFGWGDGVEEGDVVFVIGNPGSTNRLLTMAQLEFHRDVQVPARVAFLESRLRALGEYRSRFPEEAEALDVRNRMFSLSNSLKANRGRLGALRTPVIMAKRRDGERQLREAIRARPELRGRYQTVFTRLAEIQQQKAKQSPLYRAFDLFGNRTYSAATMRRAVAALQYLEASADSANAYRNRLLQISDHPRDLELRFLAARLADFEAAFGTDHAVTRAALADGTPVASAAALLASSALGDADRTRQAVMGDALTKDDPMLRLAVQFLPLYERFQQEVARLAAPERKLLSDLGRVRFDVYGQAIPPDGTFSPRITDGVVRGYEFNGTLAPPYTTFYGVYDLFAAHGPGSEWDLPPRWIAPPPGLDLSTPINFVSTADTYGGNSGSPAVTPELALVGLNFDRNIEGLSRDFIYLPERGRNVMVDVRAVQAALDHVYDADRIVLELTTGRLVPTESEADRSR